MNQYIVEIIIGLLSGVFSGITGILPIGVMLIIFDFLNIGDYRSNLGAISLLGLFPITIGSFSEFYKAKKINFSMGFILALSIIIGGYIGTKLVVQKHYELSKKFIKYISSFLGFIIGTAFLFSAYYEDE